MSTIALLRFFMPKMWWLFEGGEYLFILFISRLQHLFGGRCFNITAITTNTRPQRSNQRFGGRQSTVTMVFTRWPREDSFPFSRKCRRLSRFCNIFQQDLTPLHVKIMWSTNFVECCWRKLKLSTYLNIVTFL